MLRTFRCGKRRPWPGRGPAVARPWPACWRLPSSFQGAFARILGCSTYGRVDLVSEALHPEVQADYLGSGAIFATPTKPSEAKGLEHLALLKQLARPVPLVAIGGAGAFPTRLRGSV